MAVRLFLLLCSLLLLAPSVANGDATVLFTPAGAANASEIRVTADDVADDITVTQTAANLVISRTGGGLANASDPPCTGAGGAVSCPLASAVSIDLAGGDDSLSANNVSTPLLVAGGAGNDALRGGAANDVLAGGEGNDSLTGFGGIDEYFGEGGNDGVEAKDGLSERIACGAGDDTASNDFTDIIAECERGVDGDGDGFSSAVDCNDAVAGIHPGAPDPVENGIDEDCDGQDDRNLDRDGDGFPVPADCNDNARSIRPGALEVRGNQIDENCDQRAQPFALLRSLVSTNWQVARSYTRLRVLVVRNAPARARVTAACSGPGCTLKRARRVTVRRNLAPVSLQRFFGSARLRPGARVTVAVTASGVVGRTYTYRVRRGELPSTSIVCRNPGQKKGRAC